MRILGMTLLLGAGVFAASILGTVPGHAQQQELVKYCKADIERLCNGIAPGGGRLMQCLKAHSKEMSVGCAQALQKLKND